MQKIHSIVKLTASGGRLYIFSVGGEVIVDKGVVQVDSIEQTSVGFDIFAGGARVATVGGPAVDVVEYL